jgi:hypothetical protein
MHLYPKLLIPKPCNRLKLLLPIVWQLKGRKPFIIVSAAIISTLLVAFLMALLGFIFFAAMLP